MDLPSSRPPPTATTAPSSSSTRQTGEILAYVGSRDYFRDDILGQNDMALAVNSPGSTLKPFTYVTAFMKLGWGPGTLVLDTPISYPDGRQDVLARATPPATSTAPITVRTGARQLAQHTRLQDDPGRRRRQRRATRRRQMGITDLDTAATARPSPSAASTSSWST